MDDRLGQDAFRTRRKATGGPVEIDVIAEAYLREYGAFAEDVGLRPESAATDKALVLLEVGGALCDCSVFLMPPDVAEISDLPGELPGDCSVVSRDIPQLRWNDPLC